MRTGARQWLLLGGAFVLVTLLWNTIWVWPLKVLVVFFHEISHGVAAVLTGGRIAGIRFESNESGLTWAAGGWRFAVLNAGYVGSLAWGAALLVASSWTRKDRVITAALGAFLALVTVVFVRNPFGFLFGLAAAVGLGLASRKLSDDVNDLILKIIGVTSCGYVIPDVWSDYLYACGSDARALSRLTGVPALVWSLGWIGASVAVMGATVWWVSRAPRE